ncbi:MAG: hypothetical protein F4077_02690 [Gammaproteobacteria bacterium]|nr:hypothetical protein [Gammaproteobacteria bacterium]
MQFMKKIRYLLLVPCVLFGIGFGIAQKNGDEKIELEGSVLDEYVQAVIEAFDLNEEDISKIREFAVDVLNESESDRDARFLENLQAIEELSPDLTGISTKWELSESTNLFTDLMTGLGKYFGQTSSSSEELQKYISQLINIVSDDQESRELLLLQMDSASRMTAQHMRRISDKFLSVVEERETQWESSKVKFSEEYPNVKLNHVEEYLSCLNALSTEHNTQAGKAFSTLSQSLKNTNVAIEKLKSKEGDFSTEIVFYVADVFTPFRRKLHVIELDFLKPNLCDEESVYVSIENQIKELSKNNEE